MPRDYDVIILGSGPAGFSCAMQSSKFDQRALVVEAHDTHLGGTWINTGTIPSKALREAAKTILEFSHQFAKDTRQKPYERYMMEDLLQFKNKILERENRKVKDDFINNKVDVVRGFGRLADPHTVEIETHAGSKETYTADYILISTGSSPAPSKNYEIDHDKVLDYESILNITHIPRRLVVIGGGVHALEYATMFAALGTRVSILSDREGNISVFDREIVEEFKKSLSDSITVRHSVNVEEIKYNSLRTHTEVHFRDEKEPDRLQVIETEHVLHLAGQVPNTKNVGLKNVGVDLDARQAIAIDEHYQTSVDSIFAAGDVTGFPQLASASFSQGRQAACNMFGIPALESAEQIPYGIYTIPEMAKIGLTEQEAEQQGLDVTVGRAYFKNVAKTDMTNHQNGMIKLVFDTESLKLLGVHIVGDEAANLIHLGQSVIAFGGDVRYFIRHVMNYPTLSEAYRIAAFNGVNRVYQAGVKYRDILDDESER